MTDQIIPRRFEVNGRAFYSINNSLIPEDSIVKVKATKRALSCIGHAIPCIRVGEEVWFWPPKSDCDMDQITAMPVVADDGEVDVPPAVMNLVTEIDLAVAVAKQAAEQNRAAIQNWFRLMVVMMLEDPRRVFKHAQPCLQAAVEMGRTKDVYRKSIDQAHRLTAELGAELLKEARP